MVNRRQYNNEGEFGSNAITCPEIVEHYNKYKDAVDQFDKDCLRGHYSLEKTQVSRKWWHKLYWGLYDSAIVNSWTLWKMGHGPSNKFEFMTTMQAAMLSYVHPSDRTEKIKTRKGRKVVNDSINRHVGVHLGKVGVCVM